MTAAAARRPATVAAGSARPALRVLVECERCKGPLTEVRDRAGKPVRFDADAAGKAVRHPAGEWWAAKLNEQWCVVNPQPGEDPPSSGGGVRYTEHRCGSADAERTLRAGLGTVPVDAAVEDVEPVLLHPGDVDPTAVRRPPGRGQGLNGSECSERRLLVQFQPDGAPRVRMCMRCGRITARDDGDGTPWCGGLLPVERERGATGV